MLTIHKPNSVSGRDLIAGAGDIVPEAAGIYLWRMSLSAPSAALLSDDALFGWLSTVLGRPIADLGPSALAPQIVVQSLLVGGSGTTGQRKIQVLRDANLTSEARRQVARLAESSAQFGPSLYVGRALNLRARIAQHVSGSTELADRLDQIGIDFGELEVSYREVEFTDPDLGANPDSILESLETIVATLSLSLLSKRFG